MSTTKINRAIARSNIGACPGSAAAMVEAIPVRVIDVLTSRQLAEMLDATWQACLHSKALAAFDAIQAGAVWDAAQQRLREIAP